MKKLVDFIAIWYFRAISYILATVWYILWAHCIITSRFGMLWQRKIWYRNVYGRSARGLIVLAFRFSRSLEGSNFFAAKITLRS
jgi:hypothetical protein